MQRFVSKRSSSSVDLDSSSLDDVRAERAAISLSVVKSRGTVRWKPSHHPPVLALHNLEAFSKSYSLNLGKASSKFIKSSFFHFFSPETRSLAPLTAGAISAASSLYFLT